MSAPGGAPGPAAVASALPAGETPHTLVLGVNHLTGAVELRDRLCLKDEAEVAELGRRLMEGGGPGAPRELVILSTCNRSEIYAVAADPAACRDRLERAWGGLKGVSEDRIRNHGYFYAHAEAIRHLFRVVSSLDSLVLGEMQVFGQVKDAFAQSLALGTVDFYCQHLFQHAMRVGKRVRSETEIHEGAVSISFAAVELAKKVLGGLKGKSAGVVGAGEMGEVAAQHFQKAGVERFTFFNHSAGAAERLASQFGGEACSLDELPARMRQCDIVVSATGAPGIVITKAQVQEAARHRSGKPLFLIDIAAPRDIDPEAGAVANAFLFTIDDLKSVVAENLHLRQAAAVKAQAIIDEELARAEEWFSGLEVVPVIRDLRRKYEEMAAREIEKWGGDLPPEQRKALEGLGRSLLNKFLHAPTSNLKRMGERGEGRNASYYAGRLFALDGASEEGHGQGA